MELFEDLLKSIVDHTSSVIYMKDLEGRYILINKQHENLFSLKNDEVKGKTDLDIFPEAFARKFMANDDLVLKSGKTMEIEEQAPHEDGPHTYISVKFPVRNSKGEIFGIGGISTDITARKNLETELKCCKDNLELKVEEKTKDLHNVKDDLVKSSERLEFIEHGLEHAGDAVFFLDLETSRFAYINQMACKNLGYSKEELLKMAVFDIDPDFQPGKWAEFQKALLKEGFLKFESAHQRKDGTVFPVEITTHLVNFQGKSYSIAFARNISDRKKFEMDIVEAKITAEKANRAKSEFLSHMSHELRTPLNAVLGFGQILAMDKERTLVPRQKESVEQILVAGNHLLELINDVLDLTLIETGSLKIFKEYVIIPKILKKILPAVRPMAEKKNISIENHISETSHLSVVADPTRLRQAILNLMTNAIKYNHKGGKIILKSEMIDGRRVKIHVMDTGPGIDENKHDTIFEPFERIGAEFSAIEGTGIGLALTKKLVAQMDGTLSVKNNRDQGCCFTIELPAAGMPEELDDETRLKGANDPTQKFEGRSDKSILYIEDNCSNLKLVEQFFEDHSNFNFLSSQNAMEGLELAKEHQPSLILMDINLPEIDGLTAFNRLQEWPETQSIPVIALSANALDHEIENALNMGFKDYIVKPIDLNNLMDSINKTLKIP